VDDANVISAFWSGTTYWTLVHELSHDWPNTTKGLFDIATRHVSGEEGVRAVFVLGDGKMVHSRSRVAPSKATCKGARKGDKGGKNGKRGKTGAISGSQLLTAATMMKRKLTAPMRSMSWPSSTTSSTRCGSQKTI
jgi:hypothetical protein